MGLRCLVEDLPKGLSVPKGICVSVNQSCLAHLGLSCHPQRRGLISGVSVVRPGAKFEFLSFVRICIPDASSFLLLYSQGLHLQRNGQQKGIGMRILRVGSVP